MFILEIHSLGASELYVNGCTDFRLVLPSNVLTLTTVNDFLFPVELDFVYNKLHYPLPLLKATMRKTILH